MTEVFKRIITLERMADDLFIRRFARRNPVTVRRHRMAAGV
jgi:hypothetical protein